jgi:hypothetical protein
LKQKGKSRRARARVKNVRVERELEGKLPPFSTFFFSSMIFFLFLYLRRKRCWEKAFEIEGQKWEGRSKNKK